MALKSIESKTDNISSLKNNDLTANGKNKRFFKSWKQDLKRNWSVYLIFLVPFAWLLLFHYLPLFGISLAWKNYNIWDGYMNSPWCGWANFETMFTGGGAGAGDFLLALRNTAVIGLLNITIGFIFPIIFALLISHVRFKKYKRVCQMISYLPNFVAAVVVVQIMTNLLASDGALTSFMSIFGLEKIDWMNVNSGWFWIWYVIFGIWQGFGYGSITFVAAIANIDKTLYEAASIDGLSRWGQIWKITIPQILPMILMMWMLQIGMVFRVGFDRTYLLYNPTTNAEVSDTLFSYIMRNTRNGDLGLSTAASLFQSVVGTVLILLGNWLSRRVAGFSMLTMNQEG